MNLNKKQAEMLELCHNHSKGILTNGGMAGTGKTSVLSEFIKSSNKRIEVVTFTGKACSVLRKKGINAQTIHSTIYKYDAEADEFYRLEKADLAHIDMFCVDEASMVGKILWEDLLSFKKPIILFGDQAQLEPIGSNPYLMKSPDFILEEIMRTDHRDILDLAYATRLGERPQQQSTDNTTITSDHAVLYLADEQEGLDYQFLCGFNKTRIGLNKRLRYTKFGKESLSDRDWLLPEEKIVCLQNYKKENLFNGLVLTVDKILSINDREATVKFAENSNPKIQKISRWQFNNPRKKKWHPNDRLFDYSYVMTTHKYQGSENENIAVIDEQCDLWNPNNWRYTAITRAKENLIYGI